VLPTRWAHLRHLYPLILGKIGGHDFIGVFKIARARDLDRLRHLHDRVRARDIPPFRPVWRGCHSGWIASRRPSLRPRRQNRSFLGCEGRIVRKVPAAGIGKPGRHRLGAGGIANTSCPRPCLLITEKRLTGNLTRTMATLAVLRKDGQNVAIKRRSRSAILMGATPGKERNEENARQDEGSYLGRGWHP